MKKFIMLLICSAMVLGASACAKTTEPEAAPEQKTAAEATKDEENTQIANPFVDCETMEAAAEIAGFELTAPETIDNYPDKVIQAVKDSMLQVIYYNGETKVLVRKALGSDDISGDYNEYGETNTVTVGENEVTERGADGMVSVAVWTSGDYTYAVDISGEGMAADKLFEILETVK